MKARGCYVGGAVDGSVDQPGAEGDGELAEGGGEAGSEESPRLSVGLEGGGRVGRRV